MYNNDFIGVHDSLDQRLNAVEEATFHCNLSHLKTTILLVIVFR